MKEILRKKKKIIENIVITLSELDDLKNVTQWLKAEKSKLYISFLFRIKEKINVIILIKTGNAVIHYSNYLGTSHFY